MLDSSRRKRRNQLIF